MKRTFLLTAAILAALSAAAQWQPAGDRIKTVWGENLDPQNVLPEYPRPQLVRGEWQNLNGLWNYAIRPLGETPEEFDGEILVPFAAESALSGVGRCPGAANGLWYERTFSVPGKWHGKRVLLHFGAVDWKTDVWVNGIAVGSHTGGFTPFAFDITEALAKNGNTLRVRVWDPTEKSYQPRGKQSDRPEGIWYSSVSGIWQTVWLEAVPQRYIREVRTTPDLDRKRFLVEAPLSEAVPGDLVEVALYDGETQVAAGRALNGAPVELSVAEPKLWSPDTPFLYDLKVTLRHDGRIVDQVRSYTAMRKFSTGRDRHNVPRLMLNDKPLFQFGPLDQGWWPDGLYTAPTDEALAYDVVKTKELGYNMIRKHVKVEPARWYYHCDKAGIIVWQDMPSGDITPGSPRWQMNRYFTGEEKQRSPESEACYRKEWREIIDCLRPFVSIGVWVPFNETWGQFKTPEIAAWTKAYDPTRRQPLPGGRHARPAQLPHARVAALRHRPRIGAGRIRRHRPGRRRPPLGEGPQLGLRTLQLAARSDRRVRKVRRGAAPPPALLLGGGLYADLRRRDRGERPDDLRPQGDEGRAGTHPGDQPQGLQRTERITASRPVREPTTRKR